MKKILLIVVGVVVAIFLVFRLVTLSKSAAAATKGSPAKVNASNLYTQAMGLEEEGDVLQAKELYRKIVADYPDFNKVEEIQKKIDDLSMKILVSKMETPSTIIHTVEAGDSLAKIAKKYHVTIALIKKSNGLLSDTIRVGQRLRIWKGVLNVFVDKSQNILVFKSDDEIIKVYAVSTGKDNSTPVGTFTIEGKLVNPVWFKSGAVIAAGSPENALGSRWMGFDSSAAGYGIHGTIEPESIGKQVTAGCVRMRNSDVEELYDLLPDGTKVTIVD